jgi:hypothetical protein
MANVEKAELKLYDLFLSELFLAEGIFISLSLCLRGKNKYLSRFRGILKGSEKLTWDRGANAFMNITKFRPYELLIYMFNFKTLQK